MKRRQLILGAGALAASAWWLGGREDRGGPHSTYFSSLSSALARAGLGGPTLVIDLQALRDNIDVLSARLGSQYAYRVVAKSLPSLGLLQEVMQRANTDRLMVFHQPFLNQVARDLPGSDILLGKPMPVAAAARFYDRHAGDVFDPARQLQWLVDSPRRVRQYRDLANQRGLDLRLNIELDVGLHRGGVDTDADLVEALQLIDSSHRLELSGFMGYEPHVAKMPALLGGSETAFSRAQQRYRHFLDVARVQLGQNLDALTLNGAGSPTYRMYDGAQPANELAAGSALVKPADFDLPTLADHRPAAFIAAPVLKSLPTTRIPGIEALAPAQAWLDPNQAQAFFIYGGYWKAEPVSPPGLQVNPLYGRSTNQEMLNGSASVALQPDDWVFLRPNQSEHVFLQFGDIAIFDGGHISGRWPVFTQGA